MERKFSIEVPPSPEQNYSKKNKKMSENINNNNKITKICITGGNFLYSIYFRTLRW